ncbi:MgtC/SapB family protein [Vibrio sp. 404]|uniref:Protein MgtC n=1 Tax=Vibrio marinisediminis TaxID=2758441 RepID=A0A7W2FU94_9VIBR|nr:MgtC/SapB family protein [Vibrio marinisediminis]MBA5764338.1 MgtC/SapB family protein [Vibrio marinisediminis]
MQATFEHFLDLTPFSWAALLCCALNGLFIGVERQTRGKPVGIRTSILVISGTYFFMSMAISLSSDTLEQARVLGQIITGVGFLGAGVMMTLDGKIHGVTSAAIIWMLAALGMMIGLGYLQQSVIITLLMLSVLLGVDKAEHRIKALRRGVHKNFHPRTTPLPPRTVDDPKSKKNHLS